MAYQKDAPLATWWLHEHRSPPVAQEQTYLTAVLVTK